jgi:hypothetical protein
VPQCVAAVRLLHNIGKVGLAIAHEPLGLIEARLSRAVDLRVIADHAALPAEPT